MVGKWLTETITAILGTPGSDEYEAARVILNGRPTLWEAAVTAGLTDGMEPLAKAETQWIFTNMPEEVSEKITQRVRVALNAGIPVHVRWTEGEWAVVAAEHVAAGALHMEISTPIPDLSKLQPGAFAGAMA